VVCLPGWIPVVRRSTANAYSRQHGDAWQEARPVRSAEVLGEGHSCGRGLKKVWIPVVLIVVADLGWSCPPFHKMVRFAGPHARRRCGIQIVQSTRNHGLRVSAHRAAAPRSATSTRMLTCISVNVNTFRGRPLSTTLPAFSVSLMAKTDVTDWMPRHRDGTVREAQSATGSTPRLTAW